MPSIDWSHICRGDVYLLDLNEVVFIWNGARSNKYERLQAMQRARQLRDERGKANIVIIEDGEETKMTKDELKLFETKLLLKEKSNKLNSSDTLDENDDDTRLDAAHIKLYKCSDESGTLKVTEKKAGPLVRTDLESEVSFFRASIAGSDPSLSGRLHCGQWCLWSVGVGRTKVESKRKT